MYLEYNTRWHIGIGVWRGPWLGNPLGIPWLFRFRMFWNPELSLEFYFSDRKMSSRQFRTRFCRFRILTRHQFFQFHESENVPTIYVSGKWNQILRLNALTLFVRTITITLLTISARYTQIYENLIDISRYWHLCCSTNTGKNGWWWQSVGRRGTNWSQSPPDLDWYLDVLE